MLTLHCAVGSFPCRSVQVADPRSVTPAPALAAAAAYVLHGTVAHRCVGNAVEVIRADIHRRGIG